MSFELAKMYRVNGPLDRAEVDENSEIRVQFNPASLKVSLANSLKESERDQSSRAAQFIEKSSSSLTVELIFDTTDMFMTLESGEGESATYDFDVREDIRQIAHTFLYNPDVGEEDVEPQRCLFVWGAFLFVGIMESLEETVEFFSPEGVPLRATVSLKLNESRFVYGNREAGETQKNTPTLSSAPTPEEASQPPPGGGGNGGTNRNQDPRATSMYNGSESPRAPVAAGGSLVVPSANATAALKASASLDAGASLNAGGGGGFGAGLGAEFSAGAGASLGFSAGISAGASLSAGVSAKVSADMEGSNASLTPPAFNFGASSSLGTSIPGAFSADFKTPSGLCAGAIVSGGVAMRDEALASFSASASGKTSGSVSLSFNANGSAKASANAQVGFD